jgi:heme exporter protein D
MAHMAAQVAPPLATTVVIHLGIIDLIVLITYAAKSVKQRTTLLIDVRTDMIVWSH